MPRGILHLLRWSPQTQQYTLTVASLDLSAEIISTRHAWIQWLETVSSFAFENRAGVHYTIRKEKAQRGDAYWYAYRSIEGRTKKRYLGRTLDLTFEHLEDISRYFTQDKQEGQHQHGELRGPSVKKQALMLEEREGAPLFVPLLETKLYPPRLPAMLVEREHLMLQLDAGQMYALTLLHAPAGFGKTTLVTQWIARRQARAVEGLPAPVAWISLDSGDNDPIRFWTTVITACRCFDVQVGQTALAQLLQMSFPQSTLEAALTYLLNDLTHAVAEGVLILEDYHLIEHTRIHETVAFFIEHLPPTLHVVILTRSEPPLPLVRWHARGDVLDVQSSQMRFSVEETAIFLQQVMPHVLSVEAVRSFHTHLGGWVAGLRLLALSLRSHVSPQALDSALTQLSTSSAADRSHRPIQEFFLSEVLSAQPEPLQLFLFQTSVLGRLTGSLCDAVTGRGDSAKLLEQAEHSGFFLESLDSTGQWYRYHALFAEIMRAEAARRLGEEALLQLSGRASLWYEEHVMLVEAIEVALFARELERAAYLIEKLNENSYFSEYHTMRRWLDQLPEPLLRARPTLCFLFALARMFAEYGEGSLWMLEQIEDQLQMAEAGWRKQGKMREIGVLFAFRATFTLLYGFLDAATSYAHKAFEFRSLVLEHTGKQPEEWNEWYCVCFIALGVNAMQGGEFDKAHQLLLEAHSLSLSNEDNIFTQLIERALGDVCLGLGNLHQAASYYQQTLTASSELTNTGEDIVYVNSASGLAWIAYAWNDLEKAEQLARKASSRRYMGNFLHWEEEAFMRGEFVRLLVMHTRGEVASVQQQLNALFVRFQSAPLTIPLIPEVLSSQIRLQISDGDLAAAERTLHSLGQMEITPLQDDTKQLLYARLTLARGEAEAALRLLETCLVRAQEKKHLLRVFEIQILIALAYAARKQGHEARQRLMLVLTQTRSEGILRFFLDEGEPLAILLRSLLPGLTDKPLRTYVQTIIQAFATFSPQTHGNNSLEESLLEPLSGQEQRVLGLLVVGRSNAEIAEILIVSINTVKGHVKNLYRKLGVNTRMEASETARRLQLL